MWVSHGVFTTAYEANSTQSQLHICGTWTKRICDGWVTPMGLQPQHQDELSTWINGGQDAPGVLPTQRAGCRQPGVRTAATLPCTETREAMCLTPTSWL